MKEYAVICSKFSRVCWADMSLADYSARSRQVADELGGKFNASPWAER